jgi:hypothetical protein
MVIVHLEKNAMEEEEEGEEEEETKDVDLLLVKKNDEKNVIHLEVDVHEKKKAEHLQGLLLIHLSLKKEKVYGIKC